MATTEPADAIAGSERVSERPTQQTAPPEVHAAQHISSEMPAGEEPPSQAAKAYTPADAEEPFHDVYLPETYFHESLFQSDNTGTAKYKALLRGLKKIITTEYDSTDNPDIMPSQLAKFYEELNGDYNQLFLNTPSASIAFIYKSLGCVYSLQPVPGAQKVEEPDVPALKTEGWIMWSTIQMLLGPDEHASFLMDAVKRWDVVDPDSGKLFPKTIPRESFPLKADTRMVDWYEGVSERLKKEAEEEADERERRRATEQHAENRRVLRREDDADSLDSRGPAMAYFGNPLYRHGDGRPGIVRPGPPIIARPPRRPPISPRQSLVDRGKGAATAVGQVIRNVTSPHLWDGGSAGRLHKKRSASGRSRHSNSPPQGSPLDDRIVVTGHGAGRHQRHRSRGSDRIGSSPDDSWDSDRPSPPSGLRPHPQRHDERGHSLRHSRSHDPTPSQRDYDDYFQNSDASKRRGSAFDSGPGIGPSFGPSSDLPMAAQVARTSSRRPQPRDDDREYPERRERYDERDGPRNRSRVRLDDRRPHSRNEDRPRFEGRPLEDRRREERRPDEHPRHERRRDDRQDDRYDSRPNDRPRYDDKPGREDRRDYGRDRYEGKRHDDEGRRRPSDAGTKRSVSGRRSNASDLDSGYSGPEDRERRANRKQARFAAAPISGVDGRRYVDQSPWKAQE